MCSKKLCTEDPGRCLSRRGNLRVKGSSESRVRLHLQTPFMGIPLRNHYSQLQTFICRRANPFHHHYLNQCFITRLTNENAYLIKVQTSGAERQMFLWADFSVQDAYFCVWTLTQRWSQLTCFGCLVAEVQSNLQITRSLHCSSRGTLKPVLQVGSQAECLSGRKMKRRDKTTRSYYGQQYL